MKDKQATREELLRKISKLRQENEALKDSFDQKIDELDRANRKFRMLFENSPVGLAFVDHMTGEFLEVNDAVLDAAGYTKDEFINLSYWDITPREYEEQEIRQIEELNKTGSFGPNTKEYIRKDGTRYPISISGALYTEINGETVVWSIIEDITERKEAEETINRQNEELKYLNAAKDRFITLLAHDLKSPFTSILGILDLILHKYEHHSKEELLQYILMMNIVSKNTYAMLEDILLWIKADSNNIEYSPSQLSCSSIYNEVIDTFVPIAKSKKIKITRSQDHFIMIRMCLLMLTCLKQF